MLVCASENILFAILKCKISESVSIKCDEDLYETLCSEFYSG